MEAALERDYPLWANALVLRIDESGSGYIFLRDWDRQRLISSLELLIWLHNSVKYRRISICQSRGLRVPVIPPSLYRVIETQSSLVSAKGLNGACARAKTALRSSKRDGGVAFRAHDALLSKLSSLCLPPPSVRTPS